MAGDLALDEDHCLLTLLSFEEIILFYIQIFFCYHQVLIPGSAASTVHGGESRGNGIINLLWADPVHLSVSVPKTNDNPSAFICILSASASKMW